MQQHHPAPSCIIRRYNVRQHTFQQHPFTTIHNITLFTVQLGITPQLPSNDYHPVPPNTSAPRIRPNHRAPPHDALQYLAPTFTTIHYTASAHIAKTPSRNSHTTLHHIAGPTNTTYCPALSSTCPHLHARHSTTLHHATPSYAAPYNIAPPHINLHYSAPPNSLHHSSWWRIVQFSSYHLSLLSVVYHQSHHYFYIIQIKTSKANK